MNCFQHIPESRGAIAQPPRGGATKKKADPTTQHALIGFKHPHLPQPSALHNRTCPCPLTSDRTRNARAPTSPRSIGFCAIWDCISSSSSSAAPVHLPHGNVASDTSRVGNGGDGWLLGYSLRRERRQQQQLRRQGSTLAPLHSQTRHTDANSSVDPGRAWGVNERPPKTESPPNTS